MMPSDPRLLIVLGFVLVLIGAVVPYLMLLRLLEPDFFLSFLAFGASFVGLMLGIIGAAWYVRFRRR